MNRVMLQEGRVIPVRFTPVLLGIVGGGGWPHTGKQLFVHHSLGVNSPERGSIDEPLASLDYATGLCAANHNDFVYALPGHVETVIAAGGLDLDVAGVQYIGLGMGEARAKINFTTVVGADMDVDAANIRMYNFLFTGGIDALTGPIDVNASDFWMVDCVTRDVTGQATDFIIGGGDRFHLIGWRHEGAAAAGADTAISIIAGAGVVIEDFWIDGNFAVAAIENVTAAATNLRIAAAYGRPSYIRTRHANDIAITLVSTATGEIAGPLNIRLQDDATNVTECIVPGDCNVYQPIYVANADSEVGLLFNGTATTD